MGRPNPAASWAAPAVVFATALAACGFSGLGQLPEEIAADGGVDALATLDSAGDVAIDNSIPVGAPPRPSHLDDLPYDATAFDVSGLTVIDTGTPGTVNVAPSTTPPLPPGARFEIKGGDTIAVLVVGGFNVNVPLVVRGARSLIVVAARAITVSSSIDAGAKGEKPGPGGFAPGAGNGRGKDGAPGNGSEDSGGGGGSFGTVGAAGGATQSGTPGGAPGATYGDDPAVFLGGSPGGEGSPVAATCRPRGLGGGGGGAIQLSSLVSIDIAAGAWINAGGGGGRGGCENSGKAGGGGGSGGTIFLESIQIRIAGTLVANGGGGGGGGDGDIVFGFDAESGENGGQSLPNVAVAAGGSDPAQGNGGGGALEGTAAEPGESNGDNNMGGGGGGMGRIWLRTFSVDGKQAAAPVVTGGTISPLFRRAP